MKKDNLFRAVFVILAIVIVVVSVLAFEPNKTLNTNADSLVSNTQNTVSDTVNNNTYNTVNSPESNGIYAGVYTDFLVELYESTQKDMQFCIRDMDGDGSDELVIFAHPEFTVYTFKEKAIKIGSLDLLSGSTMLLYMKGYYGLLCYSVGGGRDHYSHITVTNGKLVSKDILKHNYSAIEYHPEDEVLTDDKSLVEAAKNAIKNQTDASFISLKDFYESLDTNKTAWYERITRIQGTRGSLPVVENNGTFYYTADSGLYKYDKSTNQNYLITLGCYSGLWYRDGIVYYHTQNEILQYDTKTYKISHFWGLDEIPNGSNVDTFEEICDFMFHGNYLYIWNSGISCFRVNLTTKEAENFLDDVSNCVFSDTHCYYIDHAERTFSIFEKDLKTLETKLIAGEGVYKPQNISISHVYMLNGELYYHERVSEAVYKYNRDGKDEKFVDNNIFSPEILCWQSEGYLCFANDENGKYNIYRTDVVGEPQLLLTEESEAHNGVHVVTESAIFCVPFYTSEDKVSVKFVESLGYKRALKEVSKYMKEGNVLRGTGYTQKVNGVEYYLISEAEDTPEKQTVVRWYAVHPKNYSVGEWDVALDTVSLIGLTDMIVENIDKAYKADQELPEFSTTGGMVQLAEQYSLKWQSVAEEYYGKLMEYRFSEEYPEMGQTTEELHKVISDMKESWERYYTEEIKNYEIILNQIYAGGTIRYPLLADYRYELNMEWALKLVSIYDSLSG